MSFTPPPVPNHNSNSSHNNNWDAHEMSHRNSNGFQKLHSKEPSLSGMPAPPPNVQGYYPQYPQQQGMPYYSGPPPVIPGGQPYYGQPQAQNTYPLISAEDLKPYGYNRPLWKRLLIGPIQTPIFSYVSGLAMTAMLIFEFVRMNQLTGSVIETNPFNPMIGPSFQVLVNVGARFTPCIRPIPSLSPSTLIGDCFQSQNDTCTVEQLCGGFPEDGVANQSYRLILPIFMHAGIVHFLLNMLTHLRLGADLERALGTPRYIVLYMASGIWGFVLSAMLSQNLTASTGCSGALFGLIGYMFIDVLINWKVLPHPMRDLMSLLFSTIISLVLGLLPGLDNFAHIGGFVVGIFMGMAVAPMRPMASRRVKIATWIVRLVALVILIVLFIISVREFYSAADPSKICPDCKYLSCLPVNGWCDSMI